MNKTKISLSFIWKYMRVYWKSLIIVVVFISLTTYFQVISPKLLGDAIDQMTGTSEESGYLLEVIKVDSQKELYEMIESGQGLSQEQQNAIENSADIDSDAKDFFLGKSAEELQTQYNQTIEFKKIFAIDPVAIENEEGLTDKQIEAVQDSTVFDDQTKFALENGLVTPEQLTTINQTIIDLEIDESAIEPAYQNFIDALMLLVLSYVALLVSNYIYSVLMVLVSGKTSRDIRNGSFTKMEKLSIRFFDKTPDGELMSRFINDIDNISNAMNQSLTQILSQFAMLMGIVYMMFREDTSYVQLQNGIELNNLLTWSMIIFAAIAIFFALFIIRKAKFYVSKQQGKLGVLNAYIDERISGQKVVKSYGLEQETIAGFEELNADLKKTSIKGQIYSGLLMPLMNGIGLINLGVLVFLGSLFVSQDLMTVGLLVAFINYSQRFFQPLAQLVSQYNLVELGLTGAYRVNDILAEEVEIKNKEGALRIEELTGEVQLKDVTFGYNYPEQKILKNIDIEVKKGQMVALVGPTGSGKTTVMNLLNRFYDINEGEILFDGINIQDLDIRDLRKRVGIVLQDSILFSGTIKENIGYGKDNVTDQEVTDAAKLASIHDYIMTLEDGYETYVDNSVSIFSTGQKQLISIARTIITNPDLLILDEATSNVDTVTEAKLQKAMNNVLENRTSFVIAHRLKTILNADIIIVLKDGEIIERGSHHDLLLQKGFYSELYYNQFVVE